MRPDPRSATRVAELEQEIDNLVGAIAGGVMKASPLLPGGSPRPRRSSRV